jgi:hypothetical protein
MPLKTLQSSNMNYEGHRKRWPNSDSMTCGMVAGRDERSGQPLKLSRTTVEEEQKKVADNHGVREQRETPSQEKSVSKWDGRIEARSCYVAVGIEDPKLWKLVKP